MILMVLYPRNLSVAKLIDSLAGYNAIKQQAPVLD